MLHLTIGLWEVGMAHCIPETSLFHKLSEFTWCILWAIATSYFFWDSMFRKDCFQCSDDFKTFSGFLHGSLTPMYREKQTGLSQ